ncbi:MAG: NifU family protein [Actinomycetota bacterium]
MTDVSTAEIVLDVSEEALFKVLDVRAAEEEGDALGLRVEVTGVEGVDYSYDLAFEPVAEADESDVIYQVGELTVMVPENSVDKLRGATLDLPSNPMQGGLVIRNPNRPNPLGDNESIELTGSLEEKVQQLLSQQINPSLAAHGGWAELVKVEETDVYLTMGGGCQGCAMSAATLREGITVMISELIPEVTEVIDTTDHGAGETPYYS